MISNLEYQTENDIKLRMISNLEWYQTASRRFVLRTNEKSFRWISYRACHLDIFNWNLDCTCACNRLTLKLLKCAIIQCWDCKMLGQFNAETEQINWMKYKSILRLESTKLHCTKLGIKGVDITGLDKQIGHNKIEHSKLEPQICAWTQQYWTRQDWTRQGWIQ